MLLDKGDSGLFDSPVGLVLYFVDGHNRLHFSITTSQAQELNNWLTEERFKGHGYEQIELEFLEYPLCNGWDLVQPEQIGALTSTYFIGAVSGAEWPDAPYTHCKLWAYSDYQIRSFLQDLIDRGRTNWGIAVEDWTGYGESARIMGCL